MLDDLGGSEHSQHYQEHQTWLEGQTIYSQPNRKREHIIQQEITKLLQCSVP